MALNFGDNFSNALHDIKQLTGKKISILQDEIGYGFEPALSGTAVEKWRYRATQLSTVQLERLAELLLAYGHPSHDRTWLIDFLTSGGVSYPEPICDRFFPSARMAPRREVEISLLSPPEMTAYRPPATPGFVGRFSELERIGRLLETDRVVILAGMAGVGKTTLAARLAQQNGDRFEGVFWHRFHDTNVSVFLRRLAGFLASFERPELWEQFQATRTAAVAPPEDSTCFDILITYLEKLPVLVCLDDLQVVDELSTFNGFLSRMFDLTRHRTGPALLITSRRFPQAFKAVQTRDEVGGLSLTDSRALLADRVPALTADLVGELHQVTGGNGAFLTLAAVVLRHAPDPNRLVDRLATTPDIERFLMEEVDARLDDRERAVMTAVAILGGYPAPRGVLEAMNGPQNIRRPLRSLVDQFLLGEGIEEGERLYTQHPLVQSFYQDQPDRKRRIELHHRAAVYFEQQSGELFQAVFNYAQAAAHQQAFEATAKNFESIINQGHARPLRQTLEIIKEDELSEENKLALWLIQGRLNTLLGDYETGRALFEQVAAALQTRPRTGRTAQLKGQVCLFMAELLERQAPPEGLAWVQRGLEIIDVLDHQLKSKLQIQAATIMMHMGNFGGALEQLEGCLEDIPPQNSSLQINAHKNLGAVYWHLDRLSQAREHTLRALSMSRQIKDHLQTARIAINLGPILYTQGDWVGAINALEEALVMAQRLGSHAVIVSLHVNLGRCFVESGEDEKARLHLEKGLELAAKSGAHQAIAARINLARLDLFGGFWKRALENLQAAEHDALAKNDQLSLAAVHTLQGEALAMSGDLEAAATLVEQARREARLLSDAADEGICWRVSGQIAAAEGDLSRADEAFNRSVEILEGVDRYQAALSRLMWGEMHAGLTSKDEAVDLLSRAVQVFEELGAKREITRASTLLEKLSVKGHE